MVHKKIAHLLVFMVSILLMQSCNDSTQKQQMTEANPPDPLIDAYVTLCTPGWGDAKNDDSYVDITVLITTSNGKVYEGYEFLRDNTGIGKSVVLPVHLKFKQKKDSITYDNVSSIKLNLLLSKPNAGGFPPQSDSWRAREEVVLHFKSGKWLTTGYKPQADNFSFVHNPLPTVGVLDVKRAKFEHIPKLTYPCN